MWKSRAWGVSRGRFIRYRGAGLADEGFILWHSGWIVVQRLCGLTQAYSLN